MCTGRYLMASVTSARLPYAENLVSRTRMHAGRITVCARPVPTNREFAHAARADGGSRSDVLSAGRRCLTQRVGGDHWSSCTRLVAAGGCAGTWPRGGPRGVVNDHGAESCMRGHLGWCGVRWLFPGCCSGGHLGSWAPTA
jgi:hypothetical protein